ncbi:hypothetical protein B0H17DRAFT_1124585 [Mycena rosella]|uniref:Uncharacterized protein n=1 Tax=Mycena rosella TaxID=1033263 RepID=A0AAD7GZY0_MYCRO|nr:hypothetical protein B0H17DRAFT_1124585 [Mycena rosella]
MQIALSLLGTSSAAANHVVNMKKAMVDLGDEDIGLFSPGIWHQSALNMLESFVHLCLHVDPTNPDPDHIKATYATKFEQHVRFFASLVCFEDMEKLPSTGVVHGQALSLLQDFRGWFI